MGACQVCLISIGILLLLVVICAVALWWNRNGENKAYDERQLVEQGKARAVADTVAVIYFLLLIAYLGYAESNQTPTLPAYFLILTGLLLQVMTYHIYCVMTHAALPFGQNPKIMIFWWALAGVVQFGNYFTNHGGELLVGENRVSVGLINVVVGVAFLALAVMHLIAYLWREKE